MQLDTFSNLVPSSSQAGKIYGLAKMHMESTTLKPVVSMIRTAEYNLAKYIAKIMNFATTCMLNSTGIQTKFIYENISLQANLVRYW